MKVMIFHDKDNFDWCLSAINKSRELGKKRFWRVEKYFNFLNKKISTIVTGIENETELVRSYIYTGKYYADLLSDYKRYCGKKIEEINDLIKREQALLEEISKHNIDASLKKKVEIHVNGIKEIFEISKNEYIKRIDRANKNSTGQKGFFEYLKHIPFIQLKTRELKHRSGLIIQKGVDVQIASDLVHFAHTNAYDIALILGGDVDLIESIRLVRQGLGKIVVIVAYYDETSAEKSYISKDLIPEADYFLNLKDCSEEEITKMSDLKREKK